MKLPCIRQKYSTLHAQVLGRGFSLEVVLKNVRDHRPTSMIVGSHHYVQGGKSKAKCLAWVLAWKMAWFCDMSKPHIFEPFISVGNLKPKLKWFFKLKIKPKLFLLNFHPAVRDRSLRDQDLERRPQVSEGPHAERGRSAIDLQAGYLKLDR